MTVRDLSEFEIDCTPRVPIPRHAQGERFICGPVPMDWFIVAARLPGRALHVGMMVWFLAGVTKSGAVDLSLSGMARIGVKRSTASRALWQLEQAGLVSVDRNSGRKPRVTLLSAPPQRAPRASDSR